MYANGKMRPVETVLGMHGGGDKIYIHILKKEVSNKSKKREDLSLQRF
jgi:hypothetical protein